MSGIIEKDGRQLWRGFELHVTRGSRTRRVENPGGYTEEEFTEGPSAGQLVCEGGAGECETCGMRVEAGGPDPCLGYLPAVSFACCGHGKSEPYVVVGGGPNEECSYRENYTTLRSGHALAFFALFGRGPWRQR